MEQVKPERILDGIKILELANKAYSLYVKQTPDEKAKLLRLVVSNCSVDAVSLYPTYRKPFDLIFERAKNEEWRARRDSNSRPSGSKPHENFGERGLGTEVRMTRACYTSCYTWSRQVMHALATLCKRDVDSKDLSTACNVLQLYAP